MQPTKTLSPKLAALLERLVATQSGGHTLNLARLQEEQPELLPELAEEFAAFSLDTQPPANTATLEGEPSKPVPASASPGVPAIPGYAIEATLGRGGMGVVYRARHLSLGRTVAIKMILPHGGLHEDELKRFRAEAAAVAKLQHPNIVQIFEIGETAGRPWFALEFVEGGSLDRQLAGRPQPPAAAATLVESLARAMQACHDRGIIHRDLKPANVLLAVSRDAQRSGAAEGALLSESRLTEGTAKIADFGLARQQDSELTQTGVILGTPSYMAPEQASAKADLIGPKSDQYALGAILYQLLTGRPPFLGATPIETVTQVLTNEPPAPRRLVPTVPLDLETICVKALQKEPAKRYADCAALADDLRRFVAHEPIAARPVSAWERAWRWRRRNPLAAGLLATTAAVLLVGALTSTVFAVLANQRAEAIAAINKDLEIANAAAERSARQANLKATEATESAKLALKSLQTVIFEIQDKLAKVPAAQDVRGRLLQTALEGLQQVAGRLEAKQDIDRATALAMLDLAEVFTQVGTGGGFKGPATAQKLYDTLVPQLEVLLAATPGSRQAMLELAKACQSSAVNLERMDEAGREASAASAAQQSQRPRIVQAKALHARCIDLWRQLRGSGSDPKTTYEYANAHRRAGMLEMRAGDSQQAKALLEACIQLSQQLVAEHPEEQEYRSLLALATENLGDWHFDLSADLKQAETCYRTAVAEQERLAAASPKDPERQLDLANAWSRVADVHGRRAAELHKGGDAAGSKEEKEKELAASRKEVAITDQLVAAAPENVKYQYDAIISYDHLARGYLFAQRYEEALPVLRKAYDMGVALLDADPENRRHHVHLIRRGGRLATTYQNLKQPAEALKVYDESLARLKRFQDRTQDATYADEIRKMEEQAKKLRPR